MSLDRRFEGIWIPKEIWLAKDLTTQEKIFFVEIKSLDNESGCFASNGYFADFFKISKTRVSLVIKSLIKKQYIRSTIVYKEGTKQILKRILNVCYISSSIKLKDPLKQKLKVNNTLNNTFNNKTTLNKDDFKSFKMRFVKENSKNKFYTKGLGWKEDTAFTINEQQLIFNTVSKSILNKDEAYIVWKYLHEMTING
ncbi:helix-turn-helix domain-containing protein [Sulfurimonas sp.]|uniref:helix-turn-helix domain-containing protein n=1 Tax=Sulfurimonas sp. TaxID=2022749 RepID=UPI0035645107